MTRLRKPVGQNTKMIDELERLLLNGERQWALYRGDDRSKPVALFLHGSPGYPLMWYSRGLDGPFIKDFVVVHWDQRGAGKSYSQDTPPESITLNQIVDDGLELIRHLKRKFSTDKIVLVGHSWDTMVAANMAWKSHGEFLLPYPTPGVSVLDCGCGPGSITLGIAGRIGDGQVVGIDFGEMQIQQAIESASRRGIRNANFQTTDCH